MTRELPAVINKMLMIFRLTTKPVCVDVSWTAQVSFVQVDGISSIAINLNKIKKSSFYLVLDK